MTWLAGTSGSIQINPADGSSTTVNFTTEGGATPNVFSDAARTVAVSLPNTITSRATYYFDEDWHLVVSAKIGGVEVLGSTYHISNGVNLSLAVAGSQERDSSSFVPAVVTVGAGIDATGTTDSTAALQAKLTAAAGGTCHIPTGTYLVSADLVVPANTKVTGAGRNQTTIKLTGTNRGFYIHNAPNVTIEDLTVDGNQSNTPDGGVNTGQQGVYFLADNATGSPGAKLRRVRTINAHYRGIGASATTRTTNPLDIEITGCESTDNGTNATGTGAYGINIENATRVTVTGSTVQRNGGYGMRIAGCADVFVDRNLASDQANNHGMVINNAATRVVVTNNVARDNHHAGGVGQTQYGIVLGIDAAKLVVANNLCDTNDGGLSIDVAESDPSVFVNTRGSVTGNVAIGSTRANGFNINHVDGLMVTGNTAAENAQAGFTITGRNVTFIGNTSHTNGRRGVEFLESGDGCGPHLYGSNNVYGNNTVAGSWVDVYTDTLTNGVVTFTTAGIVSSSESDTTVANSTAETVIATTTSPVNPRLAAGDRLVFRVSGEVFNNTGGAVTFGFKMKIGTTTIFTSNNLSLSASASNRPFYAEFVIALAATNSQIVSGQMIGFAATSAGLTLGTAGAYGAVKGTAAEDMTVAKTVSLSVTMGTADANASVVKHSCSLERIPKVA